MFETIDELLKQHAEADRVIDTPKALYPVNKELKENPQLLDYRMLCTYVDSKLKDPDAILFLNNLRRYAYASGSTDKFCSK